MRKNSAQLIWRTYIIQFMSDNSAILHFIIFYGDTLYQQLFPKIHPRYYMHTIRNISEHISKHIFTNTLNDESLKTMKNPCSNKPHNSKLFQPCRDIHEPES